jgi:DNA-binding MarR family transcriptional regulator
VTRDEKELKRASSRAPSSIPKESQPLDAHIVPLEANTVIHIPVGLAPATVRTSTRLRGQSSGPTLTGRKWQILQEILIHGPSSAARLAEAVGLSEQAVSKHLSEMFERNLIELDSSHGLRRPRVWVLSVRGRNLVWAAESEP